MRQIKFRAWDKSNKYMVYPDFPKGKLTSSDVLARWSSQWIMQFIGLHDKNGKEIYEGDIVAVKYSINRGQYSTYHDTQLTIKWNERKSGFYPFISWNDIYETEVIGNIYENPELLKGA